MNNPKISVAVPLYNKGPHIERCLRSVLLQSMPDFEIVVVDDGSTDNGASLVRGFQDSRITLIQQANQGVSVARNRAVREARAPIVAFLDADDAYSPDFLSQVLKLSETHPQCVGIAFNYAEISADKSARAVVTAIREQHSKLDIRSFFKAGKLGTPIFTSSTAVRREALLQVGGFPPGIKLGEDLDTWIRLLRIGDFVFCNEIGSTYFTDATNRACRLNPPPKHYVFFDTIDQWVSQNPDLDDETLMDISDFKAQFLIGYAHHKLLSGDQTEARRAAIECDTKLYRRARNSIIIQSFIPSIVLANLRRIFKQNR